MRTRRALTTTLALLTLGASPAAGSTSSLAGFGKLTGSFAGGELGFDLADVGDLDGDGDRELVVAAPFGDGGHGTGAGAAYLFYGGLRGRSLAQADAVFVGDSESRFLGEELGAAGDLDGDGFDDLVLGAPGPVPGVQMGPVTPGTAYVLHGGPRRRSGKTVLRTGCADDGACDASLTGVHASDFVGLGFPDDAAGDLDGDGRDELVVGAAGTAGQAGATYVFRGRRFRGTLSVGDADATLLAPPGSWSGRTMTGAGDLDGDGLADLAIGAPGDFVPTPLPGQVFVLYGRRELPAGTLRLEQAADAALQGPAPGSRLGAGLSAAGDVDGDGLGDLLVGAPGLAEAGAAGAAYVVHGARERLSGRPGAAAAGRVTTLIGAGEGHLAGGDVAGARDADGDGRADVLVGATGATPGGSVYLVSGRGLPRSGEVPLASAAARRLDGEAGGDAAGYGVTLGRFDTARTADIVVGAPSFGDEDEGAVYVVPGAAVVPAGPGARPRPPRPRPLLGLSATLREGRTVVVRGRVARPAGATGSCRARIRLEVLRGSRVVARRTTPATRRCTFAARLRVRRAGALRVRARFPGTPGLRAATVTRPVR